MMNGGIKANTKEHYELMDYFEKRTRHRIDRENKELWAKGHIYQNGEANQEFLVFREGYALAKSIYQQEAIAS